MVTTQQVLDQAQEENRSMSVQEWLDFLEELRDDLESRIDAARSDVELQDADAADYEEPADNGIGDGGD
jgi:hypothetical protein